VNQKQKKRPAVNVWDELEKRLRAPITGGARQCRNCQDGRLVAQGNSRTAQQARVYDLCQKCYNTPDVRAARCGALGQSKLQRA